MRYEAVLWDADDTLFDYGAGERAALLSMFALQRLPVADNEDALQRYGRINGALWERYHRGEIRQDEITHERFFRLLDELGLRADARACAQTYMDELARQAQPLPGALHAVQTLARLGVPQAVVTNGIPYIQRARLAASPIGAHMNAVVISGEEGMQKPDPRMFTLALERLGLPRARALMVGDNPVSDIGGAHAAGLDSCWLNRAGAPFPGDTPPTRSTASLDEALAFILQD